MTESALRKRLAYFMLRVEATACCLDTPRQRGAHSQAKNNLNRALRQLACLNKTGSIRGWVDFPK